MASKVFLKSLNEKIADIEVLNLKDNPGYYHSIRLFYKVFFNKHIRTEQGVVDYVKEYDFSLIIGKNGVPYTNETAIKKSIELGYFLIFAANKYGTAFVLKNLLPGSVVHKKYSKLNPINWFLWIFNKIVWSEVKSSKESASDEKFCSAIKSFQNLQFGSTINLFTDSMLYQDLMIIIKKIADEVGYKEELKTLDESEQVPELVASAAVNTGANPLPAFTLVASTSSNQPPVPVVTAPPPPPPPILPENIPGRSEVLEKIREGVKLKEVKKEPNKPRNPRDEMLAEIREGIKFKKVPEDERGENKKTKPADDSLAGRRSAIAPSESDSNSVHSSLDSGDEDTDVTKKSNSSVESQDNSAIGSQSESKMRKKPAEAVPISLSIMDLLVVHFENSHFAADEESEDYRAGSELDIERDDSEWNLDEGSAASSSSGQESFMSQPQNQSTIGSQTGVNMISEPPIPPKPRLAKKSEGTDASNKDSGISGGSESADQPSPTENRGVRSMSMMFESHSAGTSNSLPPQFVATPTMGL